MHNLYAKIQKSIVIKNYFGITEASYLYERSE